MTYTINEPEIIDLVKTTTYLRDGRAVSGRLKELPEEKEGDSIIRPRISWFIVYTRTWDAGTKREPRLMTRVNPTLIELIPLDVDRVEVVFLDRIHERYRRHYALLSELKELCSKDFEVSRLNVDTDRPERKSLIKNDEREKVREASLEKVKKAMAPDVKRYIGKRLDEI